MKMIFTLSSVETKSKSQNFTVLSADPEIIPVLSGLTSNDHTPPVCA